MQSLGKHHDQFSFRPVKTERSKRYRQWKRLLLVFLQLIGALLELSSVFYLQSHKILRKSVHLLVDPRSVP